MADSDKYQRLAEEYQKIKQHNAILKKAYREEQERTAKLDVELKAVESRLRTATEESDSLGFNNARLTKRVAVLQEAIEEEKARASSSSSWFGSGAKAELARVQQQLQVLQDELEVKIRENEELHMRIFETGQETGTIKEDLQERIAKLKSVVQAKSEQLEDLSQANKHTVGRLTSENTALQTRSEELSDSLVRTKSLMQQREHTMTQTQLHLSSQLESATAIISTKLPFNDTANQALNRLNVPTHDYVLLARRNLITTSATTLFKKFVGFWKEWCDAEHEKMLYLNRTAAEMPDALKQTNRQLGTLFEQFPVIWSALVTSFTGYMGAEPLSQESQGFRLESLEQLKAFQSLHERTAITFKQRLEYESAHLKTFTTNESARSYNETLVGNWLQSQSVLDTFASYISIFFEATSSVHSDASPAVSNALFSLQRALETVVVLKTLLKDRTSIVSQLNAVETQADAFMPNDLKLINNRRLTALSNASAMFDKICELIQQYIETLPAAGASVLVRSAPTSFPDGIFALEPLIMRSRRYLQSIHASSNLAAQPSVPYAEQLRNVDQLAALTATLKSKEIDISALRQQLIQHATIADRASQELRELKEAFVATQTSLQSALGEVAELKSELAAHKHAVSQMGFTPPSTLNSYEDKTSPRSTLGSEGAEPHLTIPLDPSALSLDPSITQSLASMAASGSQPPSYESFLLVTQPGGTVSTPTKQLVPGSSSSSSASIFAVPEPSVGGSFDFLSDFRIGSSAAPGPESAGPSFSGTGTQSVTSTNTTNSSSALPSELTSSTRDLMSPTPPPTGSKQPWSMVVAGSEDSIGIQLGDIDREREELVKRYYEQRVHQFQAKVDSTDRRNVELYQQTIDLERRLREAVSQREVLKSNLDATAKRVHTSSEELETTRLNYDSQLKMLTEHMVSLSDKISSYEEQLSILKNSTVRCGKCKAWNSIEWLMGEGKMGQRCSHGNHPSSFNYA